MLERYKDLYYDTKQGIKNIIRWFPIIWKHRTWEYEFIYKILSFALKELRQQMEKENRHTCLNKNVKQIKICETILERFYNNYFFSNYRKIKNETCTCDRLIEVCPSCRYNLKKIYDAQEKEHLALFCKIFEKHSRRWWT